MEKVPMNKFRAPFLAACALALATLPSLAQQTPSRPYVILKNGRRVEGTSIKSTSGILTFTLKNGQSQQIKPGDYLSAGGGPKPQSLDAAEKAFRAKNYDQALPLFQSAAKECRGLDHGITATIGLARTYIAKNDPPNAVKTYDALLARLPALKQNPDVAWGQREALLAAKQFGPLSRNLDAIAASGSRLDAARAQNMRGDIQIAQNNVKDAVLDYLRTALLFTDVANPEIQGEACYKAAEALSLLRDTRAQDLYRRVVEKYPSSSYAAKARTKL